MPRRRSSPADAWANLRRAGPRAAVTGLLANSFRKLARRQSCCGKYGDPGC